MLKTGTLVKFKSAKELLALDWANYSGSAYIYSNRVALITRVSNSGLRPGYEVYFPDDDSTRAWSHEEDFAVVQDLIEEYRK